MPSWREVGDCLREKLKLVEDREDAICLVWRFPHENGEVFQRVWLEPRTAFDEPWLLIRADVCKEEEIAHRDALVHNARLALGAFALERGGYVLRHAMPLENLSLTDLEWTLEAVAHEAARLRIHPLRSASRPSALGYWVE